MTIVSIAQKVLRTVEHNSPLIMTGLAVAGTVSTAVLAAKGAFEASSIIKQEENKHQVLWIQLPFKERFLLTWQLYIPAAGMGAITVACIVGAQSINSRRQAALVSGFTLVETAFKEYSEKVADKLGESTDQKIRDDIAKDRVHATEGQNNQVILVDGSVLCFDSFTGRYFQSNMESLRKAQNDINLQCINDMYASQNEFYSKIGLGRTDVGEAVGWSTENVLELVFSTVLTDEGKPCLVLGYRRQPSGNFYKVW